MTDTTTADVVKAWLDETVPGLAGDAASVNHLRGAAPRLVAALEAPSKRKPEELARVWFWVHMPGSPVSLEPARWAHALDALETLVTRLQPQKG